MKKPMLILTATIFAFALHAQDATPPPAPTPAPTAADDNDPAAHQGYAPQRYEDLWTKSPFAVETPDSPVTDTAEYSLVGVAQLPDEKGGMVTYVSLVQKQNQAHLLVSSDKPLGDLKLDSVDKKSDGVYATLSQNGSPLTLKLVETTPQAGPGPESTMPTVFNPSPNMAPGGQNIPMPGAFNPSQARPLIRIRRPLIHVPNRLPSPGGEPQPSAPGPGQPNSPPPPGAP
jgi:hypothetical protein